MSDLTVASTTDAQEEVDRVAGAAPAEPEAEEEKPKPPSEEQDQAEAEKKTPPDPLKKMEKRIDKLTAQLRETERQLAEKNAAAAKPVEETAPVKEAAELRPRPKLGETIDPKTGKTHETQEQYE